MSFRNKKFSNTIYSALKENKSVSLRILIEDNKDESASEEEGASEEESASDDPFAMDDSADNSGDENSSENTDTPEDTSDEQNDAGFVTLEKIKSDIDRIGRLADLRLGTIDARDNNAIRSITDNFEYKNKIKDFMFLNEDKDAKEIIADLEDALEKNEDLIGHIENQKAKAEAGTSIDVGNEVQKAIDKLVHFREKVDIVDLVEELFVQKIRLLAPAEDIVTCVEDFKELYRNEVHKNRSKIDVPGSKYYNDESVYLDKNDTYNGAAGARSQG
jgi:hypothetical protein